MSTSDVLVIGAGPYGLSIAAHLSALEIEHTIVGRPVDTWRAHCPQGMYLKSEPYASWMATPRAEIDLAGYCREKGLEHVDRVGPLPLQRFIGYADWYREQLVPDVRDEVSGLADVARRGLRLVNREEGSEARHVLDREAQRLGIDAASLPGYGTRATGHLQVASAIAAGLADAGVASEPAAMAYGLAFLPLAAERFDLVIPAAQAGSREVQGLLRVLTSPWLLAQLASLPGYDPARCGEHVASL